MKAALSGSLFIGLNIVDAWSTEQLLELGFREANPIVLLYIEHLMPVKVLLSLAVVLLLVRFGKARLLGILNVGMSLVVLWNMGWLLFYG